VVSSLANTSVAGKLLPAHASPSRRSAETILTPENFTVLEQLESFSSACSHPLVELGK
jgi:hypothetical protein